MSRLGMNGYFHIPAPEVVLLSHIAEGSPLIAHFLFRMNFGESRFDTLANRFRTADRPEVHKKQARLLSEHVAMEGRHQDITTLQFGQDRVYLVRNEYEVAGCGDVAGIRCLKIDGLPDACGGGNRHSRHRDGIAARYA